MGGPMSSRLAMITMLPAPAAAGFELTVFDLDEAKAAPALERDGSSHEEVAGTELRLSRRG